MTEMTVERAGQLAAPFPPECIGTLPRGNIELAYVGHADVTRRLLEVDPGWGWEPAGTDPHGLPMLDRDERGNPVGLWIRLTVAGVTRLGYGSCPSNQLDAVKVLVGDALRNAAMRFGVALDLWAKGDRSHPTLENPTEAAGRSAPSRDPLVNLKRAIIDAGRAAGLNQSGIATDYELVLGGDIRAADEEMLRTYLALLEARHVINPLDSTERPVEDSSTAKLAALTLIRDAALAGPDGGKKPAAFYAKLQADALRAGVLSEETSDRAGNPMLLRDLIAGLIAKHTGAA